MGFDLHLLQEQLCKELCGEVQLRKTEQGFIQVTTPFTFPDGDVFQVYLVDKLGSVRITDYGHTWMHLSYENDLTRFHEGTRAELLEQILADAGMRDEETQLVMDSTLHEIGSSILRYGQGLTRIYDLTFLNRGRLAQTFYEDLKEAIYKIIPPERVVPDYVVSDRPNAQNYPIDFKIDGGQLPLFLFGIGMSDRAQARLVTITIQHWLREEIKFNSLIVFQDQKSISRPDLARLTDVGGEMISSLSAEEDFKRKIIRFSTAA